ncbi:MAG: AIPR family protein [Desulfobulbaceae bacterium]|nr:AIPR family protein [Desulfobulbaceae bacterium]
MRDLNAFYKDLQQEAQCGMLSSEEGGNAEQMFTAHVVSLLAESGETENARVCYDEKISRRGTEHKINAYSLYENFETLDLFVTVHSSDEVVPMIGKTEVAASFVKLKKFFINATRKNYMNALAESAEIFELAQILGNSSEVKEFLSRINLFILTNASFSGEFEGSGELEGYPCYYRVIDINRIYDLENKDGVPIEIDLTRFPLAVPCIDCPTGNNSYQSYLAVMPGIILCQIYEEYGSRLLEQNVRSFLQFTGKINKGIRKTILDEPHMFMAFNNGISATANELVMTDSTDGGKVITSLKDFQIVNGGQTTASIYHTWKKNRADISRIFVQLKLTIIRDKENAGDVVPRIAEYSNTQNKVSAADLSSSRENYIAMEKLSRTIWAPSIAGATAQTRWFFERTRGQYRNERLKIGSTFARRAKYDLQHPKSQVITKEELARYLNSYMFISDGKKTVIAPHVVVKGGQKNHSLFLSYNFKKRPDNVYFEDAVALAILFKTAQKIYGIGQNALGDLRYVVVPYTIGWLGYRFGHKLNLYRIWKNQEIDRSLQNLLPEIMIRIEKSIRESAPQALYGEWAKKEECWNHIKKLDFDISFEGVPDDVTNGTRENRVRITDAETECILKKQRIERISSVSIQTWRVIEEWGERTGNMCSSLCNAAFEVGSLVGHGKAFRDSLLPFAEKVLDLVIEKAPELFFEMDNNMDTSETEGAAQTEITIELLRKLIRWDCRNKIFKDFEYNFIRNLSNGSKELTEKNKGIAKMNLQKAKTCGFNAQEW